MKILLFYLLTMKFTLSQSLPYEQFLDFMNHSNGRVLGIDFYQDQYGERFESTGTFYYLGKSYYIFDAIDQRISFKNGNITTINKIEKQVIYDKTIPGEVTIFDILTGTNESLLIGESLFEKNGYKIQFTLKEWDMSGTIRTRSSTGKPVSIILNTGEGSEIRVNIISIESGLKPLEIDLNAFEKIDLRE
ncbi:MAG: hypothetical protein ACKVH5_05610 [Fidelibacterota bacterium]